VTLRAVAGHQKAETIDDLTQWLQNLTGCPEVARTDVATCANPTHDEPATWFYVEADAENGVARLRCLACGDAHPLLDSDERWTFPAVWACRACSQSLAEVVYGVHEDEGLAKWLVVTVRCVGCGQVAGLTDMVVPDVAADVFAASL